MDEQNCSLIELTTEIVTSHVSNNKISTSELPELIQAIHTALSNLTEPAVPDAEPQHPAVSIRSSVKQDYIICLEDGAKLKMLKRYLRTRFEMTPDEYRAKWNLPRDYPMVAPAYAEQRRGLAHAIGLGRKKVAEPEIVEPATKKTRTPAEAKADVAAPKKRGRPAKAKRASSEQEASPEQA